MFDKLRTWLMGKKTYVIGFAALAAAVAGWLNGTLDNKQMVEAVVAAVLAMTIRAGVSTEVRTLAQRLQDEKSKNP